MPTMTQALVALNVLFFALQQLAGDPLIQWFPLWPLGCGLFMPWELSDLLDPDLVREGLAGFDPLAAIESALAPMPPSPRPSSGTGLLASRSRAPGHMLLIRSR